MKSVSSKVYNHEYFTEMFHSPDFDQKLSPKSFSKKYQEIASLLNINSSEHIVDFACGNGDLSFYLSLLFNPKITAIDYSSSAIDIAKDKLSKFKKHHQSSKISFLVSSNKHLPKLKNVKAIYLADVVEHLYPNEIEYLLKIFSSWSKNPYLLIHTDNSLYQFLIRPFLTLLQLIINPSSFNDIKKYLLMDIKMHVNLTNPRKLQKTLLRQNYHLVKTIYPKVNINTIYNQLGPLKKLKFLPKILIKILPKLNFLLPSFYSLYQYHPNQK